jgi:hypothetical protein
MFAHHDKKKAFGKNNAISRDHALGCIPVRNPQIAEQENDNGELCLTYQVRIRPWFQNIVQKITGRTDDIIKRKLQLDVLGSSVWRMIDGQRETREIIEDFQKNHKLNRREAEISVTSFLKELGKRGLIVLREGGE